MQNKSDGPLSGFLGLIFWWLFPIMLGILWERSAEDPAEKQEARFVTWFVGAQMALLFIVAIIKAFAE